MLHKWKTILTNWINCYFDVSEHREQRITIESVLNIISHLRENFSLDESKSSILQAHTVEQFIREKYPEFRFSNGGLEVDTEEELYLVVSLLLLFVCVNSKDVDIKNAMCNQLSIEDQEVILKFSKYLMECSPIKYIDVQTAIDEACGQENILTEQDEAHGLTSETPPALRSLHGEVRRLQAALDAERFDRDYVQKELSRTKLKLEKLLKDKEQYKTDIVNLKAKISMCCGQESDTKSSDMFTEGTTKLMKKLEQMEEKLVETQGQLDDVQKERDTYRTKLNALKQDRDRLASLHQQETTKNTELSEHLENERQIVLSLRELVTELRQHQQLNRLDSSLLECDDPDASIHSLPHNTSVCSEACANVVEVQLGEERAKIVVLKQQIQSLQEQLYELTRKTETERLSLEKILSEKDNDISNLKHRINEEIEIKNNMTVHYSDEVSKLNNDINELEQKLKDNHVQSTLVIETKMKDIQTLQEEKLSLLQSFHDETTKLENIIKNLKDEIDNERTSKSKVKEEYEHQLMKMKEKVLNRNNELVELQNNVLKSSEEIEQLHLDLRQEKQAKEFVNGKRIEAENDLRQKQGEIESLKERLNSNTSHIDQLNEELEYLKGSSSQLTETCNILEQNKTTLVDEIGIRDRKIEEQQKEVDNWRNKVSEERENSKKHMNEYEKKIEILTKSIDDTREEMCKQKDSYTAVLDSKTRDIQTLQQENQSLNNELNDVKLELDQKIHSLKEKLTDNESLTEKLKISYESQIENLNLMVTKLTNILKDKAIELESSKREKDRLQEVIENNNEVIHFLEEEVKSQKHNQEKLISEFESERLVLKNMVTVTESVMEDQKVGMTQMLAEQQKLNENLKREIEVLKEELVAEKRDAENKLHEKENALKQVIQELSETKKLNQIEKNNNVKAKDGFSNEILILNEEITTKSAMIDTLKMQNIDLSQVLQKCKEELVTMEESKQELIRDIEVLKEQNKKILTELTILEEQNRDLNNNLKSSKIEMEEIQKASKIEIDKNVSVIKCLQSQNKELEGIIEAGKSDVAAFQDKTKTLKEQNDAQEKVGKEMENSIKTLKLELQETIASNTKLSQERDALVIKAQDLEHVISLNVTKLNDQIVKLKEDNKVLTDVAEEKRIVIQSLEHELQIQKEKVSTFENEKLELQNIISNSETVVEEYKLNMSKLGEELHKIKDAYETLKKDINTERNAATNKIHEKEIALEIKVRKLYEVINEKENQQKIMEIDKESLSREVESLRNEMTLKMAEIERLECEVKQVENVLLKTQTDAAAAQDTNNILKMKVDSQETEFSNKLEKMNKDFNTQVETNKQLEHTLEEKHKLIIEAEEKVTTLINQVELLTKAHSRLEQEKNDYKTKLEELNVELAAEEVKMKSLKEENDKLTKCIEENRQVIQDLEETIKQGKNQTDFQKLNLDNKCSLLQEYQIKAEKQLEDREKEIKALGEEIKTLRLNVEKYEEDIKNKDNCICDKDKAIATIKQELAETKTAKEHLQTVLDTKEEVLCELKQKVDNFNTEEAMKALRSEEWVKAGLKEMHAVQGSNSHKYSGPHEKDYRDFHHQVDNTTSDLTHSSMESIKTISDLEKIIHDKNRTITALQSDITYLKSLIADSENKVLDVSKELELSKENCQQLSSQLKKIVHQKNEEIAELKKQVTKMSATENRASQIIKVSAKYQAIILKRIAEIKTNTVLKELTNFGNSNNGDNELRRSLNAGTITMEDLENFLETTDKHLKRCSEKQISLQKERDRLTEVNRINESEIINLKKFLTELSVSFKTFNNIKELYTHKLSRVVSVQRTVRREILSLDGRINDATMCKLERGYAAVMQDLSEAVMNLERWVERSIGRTISAEKIKQAFMSDEQRTSLASTTFQNAGLEVQLGELENSFQKLLEEVMRAQKGEGAKDAQAVTVMEVRAEYEDKLNRMKAKMKQLYQEQITVYKEREREEIASLERELVKTREKFAETSKAYEEHIRGLTTELWRVGEKLLTKKEEADWLRKKQVSGSLMSLQHVHSSGLVAPQDASRISDAHSLRSLPVCNNTNKREGRGLHMSDEEGEVFDNRWLQQLAATPRRSPPRRSPGPRLSELRWRNSLCPPHLKSSYPAETQFAPAVDEDDIKCTGAPSLGGRNQRKEVGITAYKKPGPPTPSKQAGRLSATDSELRESLRFEPEPQVSRKTSTPSRLRSLFRSNKNDTAEGTPRSKRLSIFRKK